MSFILLLTASQCSEKSRTGESGRRPARQNQESEIEAQRNFLERERSAIESYIADRKLKMTRTGTGLYYKVEIDSAAGAPATGGDLVSFEYDIALLNGRTLYSSKENGTRTLLIDKQDAEIGLHESLKFLGLGDKGLFILPSHLAFGVAGDQEEVPPKTPLAYTIKVLRITKSNN